MSYSSERNKFGREQIDIIEIDLDSCSRTYGVAPCTASGSGDGKCYNTFKSCQDLPNYNKTTKTYKFCTPRSPHPVGLDAIPNLESVSMSPAEIDVGGGLGVRASLSLSFRDHLHSDIGIDNYLSGRTFDPSTKSTFWTKLRSRNPNYQNRPLRWKTGYLVDGVYDAVNFLTRYYIIDKLDVSRGVARLTGKDPLKLAASNKSQAPKPSKGLLSANLTSGATSATLTPAGVGNAEYPASGYVAIKKEIMSFTRSGDVLTLTRAQFNTVAAAASTNDTVQLCYRQNDQVHEIVYDLLVNYADIDPAFITLSSWQTEIDTYMTGLLDGIVPSPTDVNKLLIELSEAMPHYLWWDEANQKIQLTALKPPPESADVLDMADNLLADSVVVADEQSRRYSTIFVNFGMFKPTEKLDDPNNYQASYARVDSDSIAKYGSSEIKVINSRWIIATNKAAVLQLAAKIGRRWANIPRSISFELDSKDGDVWVGQSRSINHRDIVDFLGNPINTIFQITSAQEQRGKFAYRGLEFVYGESLPEDEGGGDPTVDLIVLSISQNNINLRTIYNSLFPAPSGTTKAKFVIDPGIIIGSSSTATDALDTGSWPAGATVTIVNKGYVVGAGGGGAGTGPDDGLAGGDAINMGYAISLDNQGIIGGGGGGGGAMSDSVAGSSGTAGGGGGAGNIVGSRGLSSASAGVIIQSATNGTLTDGGVGARCTGGYPEPIFAAGGDGGNLGSNGQDGQDGLGLGGAAGRAVAKNGFILTYINSGDIRGAVS